MITFNIIVADDDRIIRKGLIKIIQNATLEFKIAGEASNGKRAFEMIEILKPDILITDVKMPIMDGIELINKIREKNIKISIIVLSGFDDYKYVRGALKGGAEDYILKPVNNSDIFKILNKVKGDILKRKNEDKERTNFSKVVFKSERIIEEQVFSEMLDGNNNVNLQGTEFKIFDNEKAIIAVFSIDNFYKFQEERDTSKEILETFKKERYIKAKDNELESSYCAKNNEIVMFYKYTNSSEFEKIKSLLNQIHNNVKDYTVTIGVGKQFSNINDIKKSYKEAIKAVNYKFYNENNKTYYYDEKNDQLGSKVNSDKLDEMISKLLNNIQLCAVEKIKSEINNICKYIDKVELERTQVQKLFHNFIIKAASKEKDFQKALELEYYPESNVIWHIDNIDTFYEFQHYIFNLLIEIVKKMQVIKLERCQKTIERAKMYIQEHFRDNITLKMVADYVYLNPNYFSKLFKEEANKNFIDYLIETRINAAKDMLSIPGIKVYEVAQYIGYDEVVSFNRAFKKVVGVSPKEYANLVN